MSGTVLLNFLTGIIKQSRPMTPISSMKRSTANIDIRVEPRLVEGIDEGARALLDRRLDQPFGFFVGKSSCQ
jgi:hypothetical protein